MIPHYIYNTKIYLYHVKCTSDKYRGSNRICHRSLVSNYNTLIAQKLDAIGPYCGDLNNVIEAITGTATDTININKGREENRIQVPKFGCYTNGTWSPLLVNRPSDFHFISPVSFAGLYDYIIITYFNNQIQYTIFSKSMYINYTVRIRLPL